LSVPTKYKRKVSSGANNCCSNISNIIEVVIHTIPSGVISAGPDTVLYSFDNYYKMSALKEDYETGKWTNISGTGIFDDDTKKDARVSNLSPKLNSFLWTVINGPCTIKDSVNITVEEIKIPNGFSPNNDGINDVFEILGLDTDNQYVELSIVNSSGTEVFYTTNKDNKTWNWWDGKTTKGDDLAEGTYYYILKMESKNTDVSPYKESGFIVLKRR
jgi:gliding motility-associated-like protein